MHAILNICKEYYQKYHVITCSEYTGIRRDINFCYPDWMSQTKFVPKFIETKGSGSGPVEGRDCMCVTPSYLVCL
jgi:hypothetical protein